VNRNGDEELETMLNELLKRTLKKEGQEDMARRRVISFSVPKDQLPKTSL
jgi:hypothetical protein